MLTESAARTRVRVIREYPTEWTWYPADTEDDDQQRQREEDWKTQDEAATEKRTISPMTFKAEGGD
jgi:hypothetical protein